MTTLIDLPYKEFRNYFCEDWGDEYFAKTFDNFVVDGTIEIEYKYGDFKNGNNVLKWRLPDAPNKFWVVYYTGSSRFALWWSGWSDS